MSRRKNDIKRTRRQKGSALLVSLMIMVGLSLLGLGFVAVSETESAIAVNERNYVQAQAAAELGVKTVTEWFQDASWANDRGILPKNLSTFKTQRTITAGTPDYYKPSSADLLCDVPLKGDRTNKFYASKPEVADIYISYSKGGQHSTYLDALSDKIFYNPAGSSERVRISDIRVYAPPWPGAVPNGDGFYETGTNSRYGVATIRVTAQKLVNGRVRAERSVKSIIAETPFPTVDGAIETSGSLVGQGNFWVYWGKILSEKDMQVNRPAYGMPWFDAKNQMWYEYGYDSTRPWTSGVTYSAADAYAPGDLVHAPTACMDANLSKFTYRCTTGGAATAGGANCALWTAAESVNSVVSDPGSGLKWKAEAVRPFEYITGDFYTENAWLLQLLGQTIQDPWLHARARGTLVYDNSKIVPCGDAVKTHPCDYDATNWPLARYSNFFQNLDHTDPGARPEAIEAVFPTMDYEFWKLIAQSASNDPGSGIYYFQYAGDGTNNLFKGPGGKVMDIVKWLNALSNSSGKPYNGLGPGFYFFDTQNSKNPQFNKGGTLTPDVDISSGTVTDSKFQMRGYVYLNAKNFGSTGIGNVPQTDVYPMPGEPYRDVGYREVDDSVTPFKWKLAGGPLPAGAFSTYGASNNVWDYQDLNKNGQFDVYTMDITRNATVTLTRPNGNNITTKTWVPIPWYEGCTVPDPLASPPVTVTEANGCSEPHEPYVNFTYPPKGTPDGSVTVNWYDPGITDAQAATLRRPKLRTGINTVVTCLAASLPSECTSNGYDKEGALVTLDTILWGAVYNEGGYNGTGNADFYGAVLMRGNFNAGGTPKVWFDECLAHGCLENQLKMQRVITTSMETD